MSPTQLNRRTLLGTATGAVVLGLSACGRAMPEYPTSPGSDTPSPSPTALAREWTQAPPTLVAGLTEVSLKADGSAPEVRTPRFATAPNLTQACEVIRNRILRGARWAGTEPVGVSAQLLAASQDVLGLVILATAGAESPTTACAVWYDARRRQSFASPALIGARKWGEFATACHAAAHEAGLDVEKVDAALIAKAAPYGNGPAMGFDSEGALLVRFPAGAVGDGVAQLVVDADAMLSDFGRLAKDASLTPSKFGGEPSVTITHYTPGPDRRGPAESPNGPSDGSGAEVSPAPGGTVRPSIVVGYDTLVERCAALTYDDGPGTRTGELLEILAGAKATATFFQLGTSIEARPDVTLAVARQGHEIGSHSSTHPDMARQSRARVEREVADNSALLEETTGFTPTLFRPPYGSHDSTVDEIVGAHGMSIVQWSVDTLDWKTRDTGSTVAKAVEEGQAFTEPIILMHDIHDSTIDAAADIIEQLRAKGVELVTVSELTLNTGGHLPGHAYCRGTGIQQQGFACKG